MCTRGGETYCEQKQLMADLDVVANRPYCWALTAEEWCGAYARHPWLAGAFAWTGFDYRGECDWPAVHCNFGIMDTCGYPKNNFWYYKARWTDEDVLQVYPHLNLPRTNLWVNTNCDEVELTVNGVSLGWRKRPAGEFRLSFPVKVDHGEVRAVGRRKGRTSTCLLETTGPLAGLKLHVDREQIAADGRDATVVDVIACDSAGREIPDCCDLVLLDAQGGLNIVGVGNGNPTSHEADRIHSGQWQRRLFNGRLQVVVRAGRLPGLGGVVARLAEDGTLSACATIRLVK